MKSAKNTFYEKGVPKLIFFYDFFLKRLEWYWHRKINFESQKLALFDKLSPDGQTTVDSWPKTLPMPSSQSWNSTTKTHLMCIPQDFMESAANIMGVACLGVSCLGLANLEYLTKGGLISESILTKPKIWTSCT